MIERNKIVDIISQAIRDTKTETGLKPDLSKAILLIDQGILANSPSIPEIMGFKVYSTGYISHISEVMIAFPEEATSEEERFICKFTEAMQCGESISDSD